MMVHLDEWLLNAPLNAFFTPFAAGFLPAVRQAGHQNINPTWPFWFAAAGHVIAPARLSHQPGSRVIPKSDKAAWKVCWLTGKTE